MDDWAREEFNQANIWCDLPEGNFPEKWPEAIHHYENALRVRTKPADPKRYAATMMNRYASEELQVDRGGRGDYLFPAAQAAGVSSARR